MKYTVFLLCIVLFISFFLFVGFGYIFDDLYGFPFGKEDIPNYIVMHYVENDFIHYSFIHFMECFPYPIILTYIWVIPFICFFCFPLVLWFLFDELALYHNVKVDHSWLILLLYFGSAFFLWFVVLGIYAQYLGLLFFFIGLGMFFRYLRLKDKWILISCICSLVISVCFHPLILFPILLIILIFLNNIFLYFLFILFILFIRFGLGSMDYSVFDEWFSGGINFDWFFWLFLLINPFILLSSLVWLQDHKDLLNRFILLFLGLGLLSDNARLLPFVLPFIVFYAYLCLRPLDWRVKLSLAVMGWVWFVHVWGLWMFQMIIEMELKRSLEPDLWLRVLGGI